MSNNDNFFKEGKEYPVFVTSVKIEGGHLCVCGQGNESTRIEFEHLVYGLQVKSAKQPCLNNVVEGCLCACLCKEDGDWYRAITVKKLANGMWIVKFIDYGNTEAKSVEEIKCLSPEYSELLPQASTFIIDNSLSPISTAGLWTDASVKALTDGFMYTEINVKVKGIFQEFIQVESEALSQHLIQCGLAKPEVPYPLCKFQLDKKVKAYLSHISDKGTVFIQELESATHLDKLMDDLNTFYSIPENQVLLPSDLFKDRNIAVAIYSKDKGFYRVQITEIDGDSCRAHYIDYGDEEQQEICSLFVLNQRFCELEYQAIECLLSDVSVQEKFDEKAKKILEDYLESPILDVEVTGHSYATQQTLSVSIKTKEGQNICDRIIAEGLVKPRTSDNTEPNKSDYSYLDLEPIQKYSALMSNVEIDGTFYLISLKDIEKINAIENKIASYCFNSKSPLIVNLKKGMPCCAFSEKDKKWLRAKVISYERSDGVLVYFVDYGHALYCTPTCLREMKSEFLSIQCQAFECYILKDLDDQDILKLKELYRKEVIVNILYNDKPKNSYLVNLIHDGETLFFPLTPNNSQWNIGRDTHLKKYKPLLLLSGQTYDVCVVNVKNLNCIVGRVLSNDSNFDTMNDNMESLYNQPIPDAVRMSKFLPGNLCVVQDKKTQKWFRGKVKEVLDSNEIEILLVDYGVTITSSPDEIYYIHNKFLSTPTQIVEFKLYGIETSPDYDISLEQQLKVKNLLVNQIFKCEVVKINLETYFYCFELENQDGKSINVEIDQILNPNEEISCEMLDSDCTTMGAFVGVRVCFVENPECIWIQQISNGEQLHNLSGDMLLYYSKISKNKRILKDPSPNQMCAVQSDSNSFKYYRAKVLCTYNDVLEVKLIDYGNDLTLKVGDAKVLASKFFKPKAQALQSKINNIKPAGKKWSIDAYKWINNILKTQGYPIFGDFISKENQTYNIKFSVMANEKTIDAAEGLVNEGYACYINSPNSNINTDLTPKSKVVKKNTMMPNPKLLQYRNHGVNMVGLELSVKGCGVNSLDEYFLRINDANLKIKYFSLFQTLALNYTNLTPDLNVNKNSLYCGMPCAVFDQIWCRGAVLEFLNSNHVTVCLVDHGRIIKCDVSDLKIIDEVLVKALVPAALRCTIQGLFEPFNNTWTKGALEDFQRFLSSEELVCTIHGYMGNLKGMFFMCGLRTAHMTMEEMIVNGGHGKSLAVKGKLKPPSVLKSFVYSNLNMVKGKEDKFYVTHVSNELFYCHLEKNFPVIDQLMDDLQKHCNEENTDPITLQDLSNTTMCFAKYNDELWYRAHFLAVLPAPNVKVLFVDYGNVDAVNILNIRKYVGKMSDVPIQALPCKLLDVNLSREIIQKPETAALLNELLLNKLFCGVVAGSINGRFNLDLYDNGNRVNDFIIKVLQQSVITSSTPIASEAIEEGDLKSEKRRLSIEIQDPFFVRVGAKRKVTASNCNNPRNFFLHFQEIEDEQIECSQKVDGFYTALRNSDYSITTPLMPGNIVCAKNNDLKWCRAEVLSVQQQAVQVQFIDTGTMEIIENSNNLKQLVEEMAKWPRLAVMCGLGGVCPNQGDIWSKEAKTFFENLLNNSQLDVRILHKNVDSKLLLVELKNDDKNLASMLVQKGFAKFIPEECDAFDLPTFTNKGLNIKKFLIPDKKINKQVYLSHIVSHERIYLQLANKTPKLEELMALINGDKNLKTLDKLPAVGQVCLALNVTDHQYYRSLIIEHTGPHQALVKFVDYGNTAIVNKTNMRALKLEHTTLSEVGFACKLPLVPSELMPAQIVAKLEDLANCGTVKIAAHSDNVHKIDDQFQLDLRVELCNGKIQLLFDFFADDGIAKTHISTTSTDQNTDQNSAKKVPLSEILGANGNDVPNYEYLTNLMDSPTSQVYISHVETPGNIYCQLNENYIKLDELMLNIEAYYNDESNVGDLIKSATELKIGSACIAKYSADNGWYRAKVIKKIDDENVKVKFVDYGNTEVIHLTNLRHTNVGFCFLPAQAVQCSLAHVEKDKASWTREDIKKFNEDVAEKELSATFVSYENNIYDVMLRLPDNTLLNKEYMEKKTDAENIVVKKTEGKNADMSVIENVKVSIADITTGELHNAYISYSTSAFDFYIQFETNKLDEIYENVAKNALDNCENKIFYENEYCIAKSPEDEEWYRGRIVKCEDKITVFFIDYGNSCEVEEDCVKTLSKNSANFDQQAIHCSLKLEFKSQSENANQIFSKLDLDKIIQVEFLEVTDHLWTVNILSDGKDIMKELSTTNLTSNASLKCENQQSLKPCLEIGDGDSSAVVYPIPNEHIKPGYVCKAVVSFATSLQDFYVQPNDENYKELQSLLEKVDPGLDKYDPSSKMFLAKRSTQDIWMRCQFQSSDQNSVICVDDGTVYPKENVKIAKMPHNLFSLPFSAVHCQLYLSADQMLDIQTDFAQNIHEKMVNRTFFVEFLKCVDVVINKWEVKLSSDSPFLPDFLKTCYKFEESQNLDASNFVPSIIINDPAEVNVGLEFNKLMESIHKNGCLLQKYFETFRKIVEDYASNIKKISKNKNETNENLFFANQPEHTKTIIVKNAEDLCCLTQVNSIKGGDVFDAKVLFVRDPHCIFVKLNSTKTKLSLKIEDSFTLPTATFTKNSLVLFKNTDKTTYLYGIALKQIDDKYAQIFDIESRNIVNLDIATLNDLPDSVKSRSSFIIRCSLFGISPAGKTWDQGVIDLLNHNIGKDCLTVTTKFIGCLDSEAHINHWLVSLYVDNHSIADFLFQNNENVRTNAEVFETKQNILKRGAERVPFKDLKQSVCDFPKVGLPIPVHISNPISSSTSLLQDSVFTPTDYSITPEVFASPFEIYNSPMEALKNAERKLLEMPTNQLLSEETKKNVERMPAFVQHSQEDKFETEADGLESNISLQEKGETSEVSPQKRKSPNPVRMPTFVYHSKGLSPENKSNSQEQNKRCKNLHEPLEEVENLENEPVCRDMEHEYTSDKLINNKMPSRALEQDGLPTFVYHENKNQSEAAKKRKDFEIFNENLAEEIFDKPENTSGEWKTISVFINKVPTSNKTSNEQDLESEKLETITADDNLLEPEIEENIPGTDLSTEAIILNKNIKDFSIEDPILDSINLEDDLTSSNDDLSSYKSLSAGLELDEEISSEEAENPVLSDTKVCSEKLESDEDSKNSISEVDSCKDLAANLDLNVDINELFPVDDDQCSLNNEQNISDTSLSCEDISDHIIPVINNEETKVDDNDDVNENSKEEDLPFALDEKNPISKEETEVVENFECEQKVADITEHENNKNDDQDFKQDQNDATPISEREEKPGDPAIQENVEVVKNVDKENVISEKCEQDNEEEIQLVTDTEIKSDNLNPLTENIGCDFCSTIIEIVENGSSNSESDSESNKKFGSDIEVQISEEMIKNKDEVLATLENNFLSTNDNEDIILSDQEICNSDSVEKNPNLEIEENFTVPLAINEVEILTEDSATDTTTSDHETEDCITIENDHYTDESIQNNDID